MSNTARVPDHQWSTSSLDDPKDSKTADYVKSIFDSGYDSQTVSTTSIQFESTSSIPESDNNSDDEPNKKLYHKLAIFVETTDLRDRYGNTVLHIACAQSDSDSVYRVLAPISEKEVVYPIDIQPLLVHFLDLKNYEGETCLHLAAHHKNKEIIEFLVKSGANVNAQEGKSGKSVLHWSVETRNLDLVQFLVKRCKADVNVRSYAGQTPLYLAWFLSDIHPTNKHLKAIVKYLRDCGAEPSERPTFDSDSETDSSEDED